MTLRQICQLDFSFFGWNARNLLRQLLNLADEVLLPHEVLIGVGGRQVGPLLAQQLLLVVGERGVNGAQGAAGVQRVGESSQDVLRVHVMITRGVLRVGAIAL